MNRSHRSVGYRRYLESLKKWLRISRTPRATRRLRHLRMESLESRQLFATDMELFRHNAFDPEDVNDDGEVGPADVLCVINAMNRSRASDTTLFTDVDNDGDRSPMDVLRVINRMHRGAPGLNSQNTTPHSSTSLPSLPSETYSIDGTGNNLANSELGAAATTLDRKAAAEYSDGISAPAGLDRPSAREPFVNQRHRFAAFGRRW
ncbi:MAG: dockerin type I domain-containing protein [Pirellulaceae bacterium]|nr:dockerin type I domain-containing protein [Pirellulaceae bacterium]